MIVNRHAMIIDKTKRNHSNETLEINNDTIEVLRAVKLLGIAIDGGLNFNLHISKIYRSAANQLNALIQLRNFLGFEKKKKDLMDSFFYSNFNCCPLVLMFSHKKSLNKVGRLQKRALKFLYNDYVCYSIQWIIE